jgi:pyrimidine-nucleoside phosphorylase
VDTARAAGRLAGGKITDMSRPLGRAVGNALEADESIRVLRGEGPADVRELCLALGGEMLRFAQADLGEAEARAVLEKLLDDGSAARRFEKIIEQQGGDPAVVERPELLPLARRRVAVASPRSGYVSEIATERMGFLSIEIGCGRRRADDAIDPAAGFLVEKTIGERVEKGETLAQICYGAREAPRPTFEQEIAALFEIGDVRATPSPLIREAL